MNNVVTYLHYVKTIDPMKTTVISSREFNQDVSRAKREAAEGPVIITDRGEPAHVLLTIEQYEKISGTGQSIVELLAMPESADIELEIPRAAGSSLRRPDLPPA